MSAVARIPRPPKMRGFLMADIKKYVGSVFVVSTIAAGCTLFYGYRRKQRYAEFYKTYDADADYERMKKTGNVFKLSM